MRMLIAGLLLLSGASAGAAEAWRWVDKDGTVHYGDTARPEAKPVDIKPASGNGPTHEALDRAADCERQKSELEGFRKATSLNEVDALGRKHTYTAEERQKFVEGAEKKMNEACGLKSAAQP